MRLRELGWTVHMVTEVFVDDGQDVPDPEWIAYGLQRRWVLLTQDKRIRYRSAEIGALADGGGTMFCLSSGNLTIASRVQYFQDQREAILRATRQAATALYVVYDNRIEKRWP
jgi:PIN like domain